MVSIFYLLMQDFISAVYFTVANIVLFNLILIHCL